MTRTVRKMGSVLTAAAMAVTIVLAALPSASAFPTDPERVGVHDPSIIKADGKYYVFGSHIAQAYSDDLVNWTQWGTAEYEGLKGSNATGINPIYGDIQANLAEAFAWAGYNDGNGDPYAVWAPDVVWNPGYVWRDASGNPTGEPNGAYMMYYSASSTWNRSCIGFVVSKTVEGPYSAPAEGDYVVVSSGFTKTSKMENGKDIQYTNAHVGKLIAAGVFSYNDDWALNDTTYNTSNAPNAIDPGLIYDENGRLWMSYGSWSGGIFMLEIDPATGRAMYPGELGETTDTSGHTDRYFGIRVAGQQLNTVAHNTNSIEGPYIVYDADTDYYYLFVTYGGLAANGGYNMRQFRSQNATGPYVDAEGNSALFRDSGSSDPNTDVGVRVMANYQFSDMDVAYKSEGHNSVFQDDDGQWYLIYHTRFSEDRWHELRVHQMFMTEDDWLVATPYEYLGGTADTAAYADSEVTGGYEVVLHTTEQGDVIMQDSLVNLNDDGTISGDITGTWTRGTGNNNVTLALDNGDTYRGVFSRQVDESGATRTTGATRMTFAVVGDNNYTMWGSNTPFTDETRTRLTAFYLDVPDVTSSDLTLSTSKPWYSGEWTASILWESSDESVITTDGIVYRTMDDVLVTLTATITVGTSSYVKTFDVTVKGVSGRFDALYYYDFEADAVTGDNNGDTVSSKGTITTNSAATVVETSGNGSVDVVADPERGDVLHIQNTTNAAKQNYLNLPGNLFETVENGYTVSMWVNVDQSVNYSGHSALFEANSGAPDTYPMTRISANLWGRINANGHVDLTNPSSTMASNTWHLVTYTVSATSGFAVYLDGAVVQSNSSGQSGWFNETAANSIQHTVWAALGAGNVWNDKDIGSAMFDNVAIYGHALTSGEVLSLYNSDFIVDCEQPAGVSMHRYADDLVLPTTLEVTLSDGTTADAKVAWDLSEVNNTVLGTQTVTGYLYDYANYEVEIAVEVLANPIISIVQPDPITVVQGETPNLPTTVTANLEYGNATLESPVTWDTFDSSVLGTFTLTGTVDGYAGVVSISITVTAASNTYSFIAGFDTFTGTGNLTAKVDASFAKFEKLLLNGVEVGASNYIIAEGSTIITLKEAYLKTLANGTYTVTAVFSDGSAATALTVNVPGGSDTGTTTPSTGDIGVSLATVLGILLSGAAGVYFFGKRRQKEQ